jgi:Flp pilus assembly protein TadG
MPAWGRLRSDRGSSTSEFLITTPLLIGFLGLVILAGRGIDARSDVIGAANDAARIASLQVTPGAAQAEAAEAAQDAIAEEGIECAGGAPTVATTFPDGGFEGNTVRVEVQCVVETSDLMFFNLPTGSITLEAVALEPIDVHRSRRAPP